MRSKAGNMAAFLFLTLSPIVRRILEWFAIHIHRNYEFTPGQESLPRTSVDTR